jgi:membrane-associated protease RseP (regulator of RpoE activity)
VPVSVEGRDTVDFDFDLGSNSPLIIYPHYRDSVQLLAGRRHSQGLSAGVGGMFRPTCATLESIAIGGLSIANVPADFPDPADSSLNSDRVGGNIGLPVFSRFRLLTDYAENAIWLEGDAKALAQPFPRNRAGVIALPAGDRLKVLMVAPGSPAEQSGWKEGMEIVAIDGHKIDAGYRNSRLSRWATQAVGSRVTLTLADNSTKDIVLADYF